LNSLSFSGFSLSFSGFPLSFSGFSLSRFSFGESFRALFKRNFSESGRTYFSNLGGESPERLRVLTDLDRRSLDKVRRE